MEKEKEKEAKKEEVLFAVVERLPTIETRDQVTQDGSPVILITQNEAIAEILETVRGLKKAIGQQ